MKKSFTSIILVIASVIVFNASAQEAKPQDPEKHVARVFPLPYEHMYFHSEILGCDKNFSVLLPKSYAKEPDRKYPVVYMLHGGGENDWEWANIPCQMISEAVTKVTNDGSACEAILVFPNATEVKSGYNNRDDWKYEDYYFQELMPYVESHYRVIADKGHRAVGGLSMGAGGTFTFAVKYPEYFSSAYAISGHCTVDVENLAPEQLENLKRVNFVIDCGDDDIAFDNAVKSYQTFKKLGIPVQFRSMDGGHATYYWYDGIQNALKYFTRHFSEQCK